ncbi:MAG: hypothetical protein WA634_09535 [Silvibacterium sp.]
MPELPSDSTQNNDAAKNKGGANLWCPTCARAINDPLVCGDCSAVICRVCGTPLESADELAFG